MRPIPEQVHRGIKGVVKDLDGNGIKGATISVRGIRKYVTTGKHNHTWPHQATSMAVDCCVVYIYSTVHSRLLFLTLVPYSVLFFHCLLCVTCLTLYLRCFVHNPVLFLLPLFLSVQLKMETTGGCWTPALTSWRPQPKVTPKSAKGFTCLTAWTRLDVLTLSWRRSDFLFWFYSDVPFF